MNTLKNTINTYSDYCTLHKKLDCKTIKAYRIDLQQFLNIVPCTALPISKDIILKYLAEIHKMYQPRTIRRKTASVKAFFHYLECEEIIEMNPFNKIDCSFRQPKQLPKTMPANIIQLFLSTLYKAKDRVSTAYQKKTTLRDVFATD